MHVRVCECVHIKNTQIYNSIRSSNCKCQELCQIEIYSQSYIINDTQQIIEKKLSHYSIPKKDQESKSFKSNAVEEKNRSP